MLIRYSLIAVCSFGFGVALMDQLKQPQAQKPQPVARQAVLGPPIICDATIEQRTKPTEPWSRKCYVAKYQR